MNKYSPRRHPLARKRTHPPKGTTHRHVRANDAGEAPGGVGHAVQSPDVTRTDLLEVDQEPSPSVGEPGAREFILFRIETTRPQRRRREKEKLRLWWSRRD